MALSSRARTAVFESCRLRPETLRHSLPVVGPVHDALIVDPLIDHVRCSRPGLRERRLLWRRRGHRRRRRALRRRWWIGHPDPDVWRRHAITLKFVPAFRIVDDSPHRRRRRRDHVRRRGIHRRIVDRKRLAEHWWDREERASAEEHGRPRTMDWPYL